MSSDSGSPGELFMSNNRGAHAQRAASAFVPALFFAREKSVERNLDAARKNACATRSRVQGVAATPRAVTLEAAR